MSITTSLNNALSGLFATSRSAELVSSNISNALTEGYGRRELSVSARQVSGVTVNGVVRITDDTITADRLLADASVGNESAKSDFFAALERVLGAVDDPLSVPGRLGTFEASLIEAAARPDSQARLQGLFDATASAAEGISQASDGIQTLRQDADRTISQLVGQLNTGLQNVGELNENILRAKASGRDVSALLDQRQQAIDSISEIVPIQVLPRENGTATLITPTGAVLLDTRAAEFGFSGRSVITPDMTIESGALSGLTLNGFALSTASDNGPISGGTLAAAFAVRDDLAVEAQTRLDAVARDLVERFQDPAVDPTLGPTDAGLFTDSGAFFDTANELGLSARLEVNALVDPSAGGALWRLRDGLGAVTEGAVGNNTLLVDLRTALTELRVPASGDLSTGARSASALAGDLLSLVSVDRVNAENRESFSAARKESLRDIELGQGINTDQELQKLLLIEQAYAANARVVTTASEMIDTLLAI